MTSSTAVKGATFGLVLAIFAESTLTPAGIQIVSPVLPMIQAEFAGAQNVDFLVPLILTLPGLLIALCAPVMGSLADRFGVRPMLIGATLAYITFGTAPFFLDSLYAIVGTRLVFGIAESAVVVCGPPLIAAAFHGNQRQTMLGARLAFMAAAAMAFGLSSGFSAEFGWRNAFLIYSFAILPLILVLIFVPNTVSPVTRQEKKRLPAVLWQVYGICVLFGILISALVVQMPYVLKELGLHTPRLTGSLTALGSFLQIAVSLTFGFLGRRLSNRHLICLGFFLGAAGCAVLGIARAWEVVAIGMSLVAVGVGLLAPAIMDTVLGLCEPGMRGRATGMQMMATYIGLFTGPIGVTMIIRTGFSLQIVCLMLAAIFIVVELLANRVGAGRGDKDQPLLGETLANETT